MSSHLDRFNFGALNVKEPPHPQKKVLYFSGVKFQEIARNCYKFSKLHKVLMFSDLFEISTNSVKLIYYFIKYSTNLARKPTNVIYKICKMLRQVLQSLQKWSTHFAEI